LAGSDDKAFLTHANCFLGLDSTLLDSTGSTFLAADSVFLAGVLVVVLVGDSDYWALASFLVDLFSSSLFGDSLRTDWAFFSTLALIGDSFLEDFGLISWLSTGLCLMKSLISGMVASATMITTASSTFITLSGEDYFLAEDFLSDLATISF
jgi:hypothetical protein